MVWEHYLCNMLPTMTMICILASDATATDDKTDARNRLWQSGLLPAVRRGVDVDSPAALLRGSPLSHEAKDHLFGSLPQGRGHGKAKDHRRGHYWVYYFENAELALLHLVSHPAFGAGIGETAEGIDSGSLRVSFALKELGDRGGSHIVLLLTWHLSAPRGDVFEEPIPVGPDLTKEADAQRRRAVLCPRLASLPLDQLLHAVLCKDSPVTSPRREVPMAASTSLSRQSKDGSGQK
ncbi:unnamed protein product [Durusdinium trenchii]|uniref:Uncharacterized protein n=1 Tax=Durusdinium trenchii TaxID=1381693 RepID=A0ABP0MVJ8_9DINO